MGRTEKAPWRSICHVAQMPIFVARKNVAREVQVLSMADVKWMRSVVCEDFKSSVHELMGMDQTIRLQTAESI